MIDTHCHLDLPIFDLDRDIVLERSRQAGVHQWLVPGIRLTDFPRLTALSVPGIHFALGLHPLFTEEHPNDAIELLQHWLDRTRPLAVGEIGLDYLAADGTHEKQWTLFEAQLNVANDYHLPVLLHVRKAHDQTLTILKRLNFLNGGIVHAFGGSLQQAHRYMDCGFCLGFGGVVTHERSRRIRKVAASVPERALVLETDAPDLPFAGYEGQRNEPCRLPQVVQTLAQLRHCSEERIVETVNKNSAAILALP